jgi:hypothetical protein
MDTWADSNPEMGSNEAFIRRHIHTYGDVAINRNGELIQKAGIWGSIPRFITGIKISPRHGVLFHLDEFNYPS